MTTDELIKETLEHDAKATPGPWDAEGQGGIQMDGIRDFYLVGSPAVYKVCWGFARGGNGLANSALVAHYRTAAPLLARKLQRAMEQLRVFDTTSASRWVEVAAQDALLEIEAME